MKPAIALQNVSRAFGATQALRAVSARVERDRVVGLLGHNGAGKTTLMRLLTGALEPSAGSVRVMGFNPVTESQQVARHVGYLAEDAPLWPELSVQETLLTIGRLRNMKGDRLRGAFRDAIDVTQLSAQLTRPVGTLSRGLRQRVGLAQAMLHRPDVLILDEPTTGLDPQQITSFREVIRAYGREHTVLLSTHLLQEVEALCDEALILREGELTHSGTLRLRSGHRVTVTLRAEDHACLESFSARFDAQPLPLRQQDSQLRRYRVETRGHDDDSELLQWLASHRVTLVALERRDASVDELFEALRARSGLAVPTVSGASTDV